jgi:hypothetical protein
MPQLTFRRDATIVVSEHGEPDRLLDAADPLALLVHLRSAVALEEGLTAAGLMRCLRPWSAVVSKLAWIDFDAWERAVAVGHLNEVAPDSGGDGDEPPLDKVEISPCLHANRNRKGPPSLDITWTTCGVYAEPVVDNGATHRRCGLSLAPVREWAYLPLVVEERLSVSDLGPKWNETSGVLSATTVNGPDDVSPVTTTPTLFDTVVLGFLDEISYHGDPEEAAERRDEIGGMVADIAARLDGDGQQ